MSRRGTAFRIFVCLGVWAICLGCSTFKFTPLHPPVGGEGEPRTGLAIQTGEDLRPANERRPAWCQNAEKIVARALAEEVRDAKLFRRVKIHADRVNPARYNEYVQFRVRKFQCYNQAGFLESTGRTFLRFQGLRGALIADSIPSKYISQVEVEFEVRNGPDEPPIFDKTYSATRTDSFNGYQGEKPKIQQTSAALEDVLTQFLVDLRSAAPSAGQPAR